MEKNLVKISEMAKLHGISRQTLILYDKNGLLRPAYVSDTGYRYYSVEQIPRLRLICLLKDMGITLAKIKQFLEEPAPEDMVNLISGRIEDVDRRIAELQLQREELCQFTEIFEHVNTKVLNIGIPRVEWIPARRAVFSPYSSSQMGVKRLHLALMGAWDKVVEAGLIPSRGFGSLLWADKVRGEEPLEGAGSIVILPRMDVAQDLETIYLPEGNYAVMYKVAMPYDHEPVKTLLDWVESQGLSAAGEVVDRCLLDSVFYDDALGADFCRLEMRLA